MRNFFIISILIVMSLLSLVGCHSTSKANSLSKNNNKSLMKEYSYDKSKPIGKTNTEDDKKITQQNYPVQNIPGLNVQTVVFNMQNDWGIKPVNRGFQVGWYTYAGERSDNGISEGYAVQWRSPNKVDVLDFSLVTNKNNKNVSASQLKAAAMKYLSYAATLPYTGANPKVAKQWVQNELKNYHVKSTVGRKIGQVYFILGPFNKLPDNQMMSELTITCSTMGKPANIFTK